MVQNIRLNGNVLIKIIPCTKHLSTIGLTLSLAVRFAPEKGLFYLGEKKTRVKKGTKTGNIDMTIFVSDAFA